MLRKKLNKKLTERLILRNHLGFRKLKAHLEEYMQSKKIKLTTYSEAINDAIKIAMRIDKKMVCYGLGVTDPKGVFGTTKNLNKFFGNKRVFDVPASENALTGISIGLSLNGIRSVVTHQRLDFFILALDQLFNAAAKWYYMFGSKKSVPITVRLIMGRGWGQGPTHSQNLQALFSHIPGLKVVMPSNARDAKGLLLSSIFDPNPVIFLEHRWLHGVSGKIPSKKYFTKIGKAKIVNKGKGLTIVCMSYLVLEAFKAKKYLKQFNINPEIIDIRTIKPLDFNTISSSLKKTKRLLILDTGAKTNSVASEILALVSESEDITLKSKPVRICMPDCPEPTSYKLTKFFYNNYLNILEKVLEIFKVKLRKKYISKLKYENFKLIEDTPGEWFKGPF